MAWGSRTTATPKAAPFHSAPAAGSGPTIDATTVTSLLALLSLIVGAYAASLRLLPRDARKKTRVLFIWHLFDALVHFIFEGSFLYNCFFVSYSLPTTFSASSANHPHIQLFTPPDVYWLGAKDKLYGANYGTGPLSKLWQEYAKADKRWGGVDLGVVTLEVLTVFVATPLALWCAYLLTKEERKGVLKRWFWMMVLATAELYGGECNLFSFFLFLSLLYIAIGFRCSQGHVFQLTPLVPAARARDIEFPTWCEYCADTCFTAL